MTDSICDMHELDKTTESKLNSKIDIDKTQVSSPGNKPSITSTPIHGNTSNADNEESLAEVSPVFNSKRKRDIPNSQILYTTPSHKPKKISRMSHLLDHRTGFVLSRHWAELVSLSRLLLFL